MPLAAYTIHPEYRERKQFHPTVRIGNLDQMVDQYQNILSNCSYTIAQGSRLPIKASDSKINVIHINCRSICSDEKFDELILFLHKTNTNWTVICLSLTWLTPDIEAKKKNRWI